MTTTTCNAGLRRACTAVTLLATLAGTVIGYLSLAATVKWPPFRPAAPAVSTAVSTAAMVSVFKGDGARGVGNCSDQSCAFISVALKGFPAGETVECIFDSSSGPGPFRNLQAKVDSNGSVRVQSTNYFGNQGGWVSAACNGVRGELNPW